MMFNNLGYHVERSFDNVQFFQSPHLVHNNDLGDYNFEPLPGGRKLVKAPVAAMFIQVSSISWIANLKMND